MKRVCKLVPAKIERETLGKDTYSEVIPWTTNVFCGERKKAYIVSNLFLTDKEAEERGLV